MRYPGETGRDQDTEHGIAGNRVEQNSHARGVLGRSKRVEKDVKRKQHQT
jgi:hypothetical protein